MNIGQVFHEYGGIIAVVAVMIVVFWLISGLFSETSETKDNMTGVKDQIITETAGDANFKWGSSGSSSGGGGN